MTLSPNIMTHNRKKVQHGLRAEEAGKSLPAFGPWHPWMGAWLAHVDSLNIGGDAGELDVGRSLFSYRPVRYFVSKNNVGGIRKSTQNCPLASTRMCTCAHMYSSAHVHTNTCVHTHINTHTPIHTS